MTQSLTEEKIKKLLQELQSEDAHRRKLWVESLSKLKESDGRIAYALENVAETDSNEQVRRAARKALLAPAHQPFTYIRKSLPIATSSGKVPIGPAERTARNWYWWLWWSPLVTVPTFIFFIFLGGPRRGPGYDLICGGNWSGCDWDLAGRVDILIAVMASALWHLILLVPTLNKESKFVRWHGRQALLLAGARTVVPLAFGLGFGEEEEVLWFIPILIAIWLFGTLWGGIQAARGDCSLMRWFGRAEALPSRTRDVGLTEAKQLDREALVEIIRHSRDPAERSQALLKLEQLGLVRSL